MDIIRARLISGQEPPGPPAPAEDTGRYSHRSIETLVVVLAVITIVGVAAGIVARLCGGRHFGGDGEHDIEGWVERRCRSCIDGGVPAPAEDAGKSESTPKPAEEEKK